MKKIVVVVPSYKNERWCVENMQSVLSQNYQDFRVIYTDDCSPDNTSKLVNDLIAKHNAQDKVIFIQNTERKGAMCNLYDMIHSCEDDEIVVTLDGDDTLAHSDVLSRVDLEYSNENVWMTYGSYADYPGMTRGCCRPYEQNVIDSNLFRKVSWRASHLRTFYSGLFKKIKKEDFYDPQGKFLDMAWDLSFMLPMLEMSGMKCKYVNDILYLYNNENPISDYRVNVNRQGALDHFIRSKPRYSKLDTL